MIARMLPDPRRLLLLLAVMLGVGWIQGCAARSRKREARKIPDRGYIDPEQARELDKVTMPHYVVEPPDELEIAIRPLPEDWNTATVVVQQDGIIDLGLLGDVYVVGATLPEVEARIARRLNELAVQSGKKPQPYRVSARLTNSQSKHYYVMGAVATQGRVPIRGNETVLDAILQAG